MDRLIISNDIQLPTFLKSRGVGAGPMIALTHLVLALLLIKFFGLDRNAAFATLLFGVFIDLDHLFGVFDFLVKGGLGRTL